MKISKYSVVAVSVLALLMSAQSLAAVKAAKTEKSAKSGKAPVAESPNMPVAKIGNSTITLKELDASAKGEMDQLQQAVEERKAQIREHALDALIIEKLVSTKAKSLGKTPEAYMKEQVEDKVTAPTETEISATYEQAKARNANLPPMSQLKDQIVSFLKQQKAQTAQDDFNKKLKAEAKVQVLLKSPHAAPVQVEAKGEMKGPADAKVTIVAFSDYQCPFCSRGEESIAEVMKAYPTQVKLYFRDYPLPMHTDAPKASEAAHCAKDQGKYWEMHDKLFANQKSLKVEDLKKYAKEVGVSDTAKFAKCLDSGEKKHIVDESMEAGRKLNVNGTPAFFVNGILLSGAQPFEKFKQIIDEQLAAK